MPWYSSEAEHQVTFSNPSTSAVGSATTYVRALLDLLGDRDPFTIMGELLPWLDARLRGITDQELRRPEAPGKWSVIQVVQHLADSDLVAGYRIRMMLTEDQPTVQAYDQDQWAREFHYATVPLELALDQLRALRAANLHLWNQLTPADLERIGRHTERGPESVAHLLRLMGAHDLVHRAQIHRILSSTT
ncbi:MAG TPA: DinB family protein [Gemmatimonadales bacterium]|nr:DinB family protein [Gemmatimonadales bacterium]